MNEEQNTTGEHTETSAPSDRGNGLLIVGVVGAVLVLAGLYYFFVLDTATDRGAQQTTNSPGVSQGTDYPEIVAVVNGEEISREELILGIDREMEIAAQQGADVTDTTVQMQIEASAMERLINTALLLQGAKSSGLVVSEEEVTAEYARVAGQFENIAAFEAAVAERGITETQLREDLYDVLLINAFIASDTFEQPSVSTEEIKAVYDEVAATQTVLPPLEEVSTTIEAQLMAQKQQAVVSSYIESLRAEAAIEVRI